MDNAKDTTDFKKRKQKLVSFRLRISVTLLQCIGQTRFDDLKHWQRVSIFISGVTASVNGGQIYTKARLSAETFNQYSKCAKNLLEMSGLTRDQLGIESYDMAISVK